MTETVTETPAVPVDTVIDRYIKLRDKKAELKAAYDKSVEDIDKALVRCENYLMATMKNMGGIDSLKTDAGTAFLKEMTSAKVADWTKTLPWIIENQSWDILKKDVSKSFVEAYKEEHNDLPPGVSWRAEVVLQVRRN